MNSSRNVTDTDLEEYYNWVQGSWHLIIVWFVLACVNIIGNTVVLIISKCASGGKSPILVFMRSLCVADYLIGIFGLFKALVLQNIKTIRMNCFLPESLLITACTCSILTLFWLNIDCCLRFSQPLIFIRHTHKRNVVTGMLIVWDASFIVGFLPLIGWNTNEHICLFGMFYNKYYLIFITTMWSLGVVGCLVAQLVTRTYIKKVLENKHLFTPGSKEFHKHQSTIITNRIETISWILCFLPFAIFVIVRYIQYPSQFNMNFFNKPVVYYMPVFVLRSTILGIFRGYRTTQISNAPQNIKKYISRVLSKNTTTSFASSIRNSFKNSVQNSVKRRLNDKNTLLNGNNFEEDDECRTHEAVNTEIVNPCFPPKMNSVNNEHGTEKDKENISVTHQNGMLVLEIGNEAQVTHL